MSTTHIRNGNEADTRSNTSNDVVRLSVNLAPDVAATLKEIAAQNHISVTEAVRRAIGVLKFIQDETAQGNDILVSERDGRGERLRKLVII